LGSWLVIPSLLSAFVAVLTSAFGAKGSSKRLTCHPATTLSLCASPDFCLVLLWEFGLSPRPPSLYPLCLLQPLLGTRGSSGRLAYCPTPALSLCCFVCLVRVWLLAPPLFSRACSVFHPTSAVGVRLQFTVYTFQLGWGLGCSVCPGLHCIMFLEGG
jgi:hypothetical protein